MPLDYQPPVLAEMTKRCYFLPMVHRIAILVYPGFELLDATGPASVFSEGNRALVEAGRPPHYRIELVSKSGGLIGGSSGIAVDTRALSSVPPGNIDTLLIAGATSEYLRPILSEPDVCRWTSRCAGTVDRLASVCAGSFLLAALGLLDGKRATTHWDACSSLAQMFPSVSVDAESLYVVDGNVWTSAGVTSGIDMAIAMVAHDLGSAIAVRVAKWLVLYARRPGYQSQFSPVLQAQVKGDSPFADLIDWVSANLHRKLDVATLAARAGLSERSFYRKFAAATGEAPSRFVETLRLDAARMLLSKGIPLKTIATQVGLSPSARLSKAFERRFGVSPKLFRETHASLDAAGERPT